MQKKTKKNKVKTKGKKIKPSEPICCFKTSKIILKKNSQVNCQLLGTNFQDLIKKSKKTTKKNNIRKKGNTTLEIEKSKPNKYILKKLKKLNCSKGEKIIRYTIYLFNSQKNKKLYFEKKKKTFKTSKDLKKEKKYKKKSL